MTQTSIEDLSEPAIEREDFYSETGGPIHQIEMLAELARNKWSIAKITLIFVAIGLILCFTLPERFEATARITTPVQVPSIATMLDESAKGLSTLASAAGGSLGLRDPNAMFVGLLQSQSIADALISQFKLQEVYGTGDMTGTRRKLLDQSDIKGEKNDLVSISVTDRDPKRAAAMANAYIEQLRLLTRRMASKEAERQAEFYQVQIEKQREALIAAEFNLQKVEQNRGVIHIGQQSSVMFENVGYMRAQIAAKQVELQALRLYSTEQNSDVKLAEKQLASLQDQAAKMSTHGSSPDYADLGLKDIPNAGIEWVRASREVNYQTELYGALIKQYEAFRLDQFNDAFSIQVIDQATIPDRRSFPKRTTLMLVVSILGLISSILRVHFQRKWREWRTDPNFVLAFQALKTSLTGR